MNTITPTRRAVSLESQFTAVDQNGSLPETRPSTLQSMLKLGQRYSAQVGQFEEVASRIEADENLSLTGRAAKIEEAARKAKESLASVPRMVESAKEERARLRNSVAKVPDGADPHELSEIRRYVKDMATTERVAFLKKNAHDQVTVGAVLAAKPFLSGLSDVEVEHLRDVILAARHPDRAAVVSAYDRLIDAAESASRVADKLISERTESVRRMGTAVRRTAHGRRV